MTMLEDTARHILSQALSSETGIIVTIEASQEMVAPTQRAKQILYRFKRENADYKCLQIIFSPDEPDKQLWIIKRETEIYDEE